VVTGPLTVDVVQRYVDDHRDDVQTCHKLEQERSGTRWGTLTLVFTIDTTGHVSEVRVSNSTIPSRDLESCIAHVTGSFEFPAPRTGEVNVIFPITF
jgi:outer membrane biosynthesis protein TonB